MDGESGGERKQEMVDGERALLEGERDMTGGERWWMERDGGWRVMMNGER